MINKEHLRALGINDKWLDPLNATFEKFEINTPKRQAAFIGQCAHESNNFNVLEEGLNYKAEALMKLFSRARISEEDCNKYGRTAEHSANQSEIANCIYGGEWGKKNLGNTELGDGNKFHGRGLIQLTGRANYEKCGNSIGADLLSNPNVLCEPLYAVLSAGWFWSTKGLNQIADTWDTVAITKKVNGGTIGLDDRVMKSNKALEVLTS
jgi:putative chitinase